MTTFDYTEAGGGGRLETVLAPEASIDGTTWGMLSHNVIPGIARVSRSQLDDRVSLAFGVVGTTLARTMDQQLRKEDVLWMLDAMVEAVLAVERHMIPVESVVYDPDHVYVDAASRTVTMVCVPVEGVDHGDPVTFFKKVIFNLRYDQRDDTTYVSDLINVLGGSEAHDLSRLARLLRANRLTNDAAHRQHVAAAEPAPVDGVHVPPGVAVPVVSPVAPDRPVGPPQPGAFQVPGGATVAPQPRAAAAKVQPADDEEQISLFYLLQHYTKENKDRYDRQRKARADAKELEQAEQPVASTMPPPGYADHGSPEVPAQHVGHDPAHGYAHGYASGAVAPQGAGHGGFEQAGAAPAAHQPYPYGAAAVTHVGAGSPVDPRHAGPPGQPLPPSPYVLFGLRDEATGVTTWLEKPITVVGRRRARVDVAISDDLVSKQHAILQVDAGVCSIIDNASTNGVEVDGQKIAPLEPVVVHQGTHVKIGEARFTVVEHR